MKLDNVTSPRKTGERTILSERALQLCQLAKLLSQAGSEGLDRSRGHRRLRKT